MKGNSTLIEHQLRVRCRNGDYRWLFLRGKVMDWNMQGRAMRIVGSVRDVEEEKQQADHERTRNEQILHTARLVSMGEIASALAHEINQPLTAICNFSAVALHKLKTKVPLKGALRPAANHRRASHAGRPDYPSNPQLRQKGQDHPATALASTA
jgi:signal transduction histidine kinase